MAFKLKAEPEPTLVNIKAGPMRNADGQVGVAFSLDTVSGELDGKINFGKVKTKLKSKAELIAAIEKAVNDVFQAQV